MICDMVSYISDCTCKACILNRLVHPLPVRKPVGHFGLKQYPNYTCSHSASVELGLQAKEVILQDKFSANSVFSRSSNKFDFSYDMLPIIVS